VPQRGGARTPEKGPWTLDLMRSRDRRFALAGFVASVRLVGVFASATGQGVRYVESLQFCVNGCHAVIEPEGTAALHSPHAKLACAECHVGSGAVHFARAKLEGMRQLWGVVSGRYQRPMPVPVAGMLPAEELCESCHARERWVGSKEKHYSYRGRRVEQPSSAAHAGEGRRRPARPPPRSRASSGRCARSTRRSTVAPPAIRRSPPPSPRSRPPGRRTASRRCR
jgi:nitrate/TMAO reductase-like tetraheme cytochrome c subunit